MGEAAAIAGAIAVAIVAVLIAGGSMAAEIEEDLTAVDSSQVAGQADQVDQGAVLAGRDLVGHHSEAPADLVVSISSAASTKMATV